MDALAAIHPVPADWLRNSDLAKFVPTYCQRLVARRYADQTQRAYVCCVAHFARWMTRRRLAAHDLADDDARRFLDEHLPRCSCPPPVQRCRHQVRAALRHLLASLREAGILAEQPVADVVEEELRRFDEHMRHAMGLAVNTRAQRLRILQQFLLARFGPSPVRLPSPNAHDLRRLIDQQLQRWSPASAHVLASTLRGYVRFRVVCGDQIGHLLPVIASPANWRLGPLPETLSPTEVTRLLGAFSPVGRSALRAYAMVRCVADLGLRASEVVGLDLDDIDWGAGTIRIGHNKSRRVDVLPLPKATGSAIARYLRSERPRHCQPPGVRSACRPGSMSRFGPGVVRRAVCEAYRRCGLTHTRVHVLRHTLAGRLLDRGGTLKEVADVLRHRALDTSLDLRQGRYDSPVGGGSAVAGERSMKASTPIQTAVQRYLGERRRLGFDLRIAGEQLMRFARYADDRSHRGPLTLDLQLDWAREHVRRTGSTTWARRLEIVRPFATYYRQFEPQTAVPDSTVFGRGHRRLAPHIYTEREIAELLDEAGRLGPLEGCGQQPIRRCSA